MLSPLLLHIPLLPRIPHDYRSSFQVSHSSLHLQWNCSSYILPVAGKRVVQAFDKTASIAMVFGFIKGVHAEDITGPFDVR